MSAFRLPKFSFSVFARGLSSGALCHAFNRTILELSHSQNSQTRFTSPAISAAEKTRGRHKVRGNDFVNHRLGDIAEKTRTVANARGFANERIEMPRDVLVRLSRRCVAIKDDRDPTTAIRLRSDCDPTAIRASRL